MACWNDYDDYDAIRPDFRFLYHAQVLTKVVQSQAELKSPWQLAIDP